MLKHLSITDLVLIEQVALSLDAGLTVLTGETGAGKSILLDGLGLALGERSDSALVRAGAAQAMVTAEFAVPDGHRAHAFLADHDLPPAEDGALIVRRTLKPDGKSRAHVQDMAVSAGLLKSLGTLLVEVHGQHDDRGLLAPRGHLALLDAFAGAGTADLLAEVGRAHHAVQQAEDALAAGRAEIDAAAADREWLDHAIAELGAIAPVSGEEAELADIRQRMKRGLALAESMDAADRLISGSDGALSALRQAARRLERMAADDPALAQALEAVDRALVEGDAIEAAMAQARARLDVSPEQLDSAEARLFDLRALARKHRVPVDGLAALLATLRQRQQAAADSSGRLDTLHHAAAAASERQLRSARELSAVRHAAAARLDAAVNSELPALRLESARFRTAIAASPPGPTGMDRVQFEVATNAGTEFGPLTRIASGGELSRFVLALKVALASSGTAGTLVFDEIDRGVGGATASAIGERLARVADGAQVLVVTHSPQVAAAGRTHGRISKAGGQTLVALLDQPSRIEEIARMLSGADVTAEARAQARRLLGAP